MASSAVHSCINVSNTNNLGLATFGGGDINHKPCNFSVNCYHLCFYYYFFHGGNNVDDDDFFVELLFAPPLERDPREVGLGGLGYKVTKYIYATPDVNILIQNGDSCTGQWIGYVAVSTDEAVRRLGRRDVVITFRGTVTNPEWIANLMGSSLALLLAYDISELGLNRSNPVNPTILDDHRVPITVFSFGGPRVGNSTFKERCEELGIKVLRIVNINDPITKLPGVLFNENFRVLGGRYEFPWSCSCYAHVGIELALEFFNVQNPSCVHDLETYISLLKSPKTTEIQRAENIMPTVDLLQKVRDFLLSAQNFNNMLPWRNAAVNMTNLIQLQSQRT
ncbi:hypothetical protein CRG98_040749 [Punica granatum]|uniref:Fungal lipase-type domain-containing protein n=1 Tax=Punica granatum TaxID=22663 RepID=A0A2I0I4B5_PUNGR|nr:hypothetical protein CRG98_040749 [Punica granatum]